MLIGCLFILAAAVVVSLDNLAFFKKLVSENKINFSGKTAVLRKEISGIQEK
jgi:hypothetical protein